MRENIPLEDKYQLEILVNSRNFWMIITLIRYWQAYSLPLSCQGRCATLTPNK